MARTEQPGSDSAVNLVNAQADGAVLVLCEHASADIPQCYGDLGLRPEWRDSHAAWDPGAMQLAEVLARALDAPLVAGAVSRLVYDVNRPPDAPDAMPVRAEVVEVPGNASLSDAEKLERVETIYRPFCDAVDALLAEQSRAIVTVHSFTPVYFGKARATEIGVLHDSDARLAEIMLRYAPAHRKVDRNLPYGPEDGVTHSLRRHGISRRLPNVMLEVRNDLLGKPEDIEVMAAELLTMLRPALAAVPVEAANA